MTHAPYDIIPYIPLIRGQLHLGSFSQVPRRALDEARYDLDRSLHSRDVLCRKFSAVRSTCGRSGCPAGTWGGGDVNQRKTPENRVMARYPGFDAIAPSPHLLGLKALKSGHPT